MYWSSIGVGETRWKGENKQGTPIDAIQYSTGGFKSLALIHLYIKCTQNRQSLPFFDLHNGL